MQVLTLGGELLGNAEGLLSDGLHTSEISDGYQKAAIKVCLHGRAALHAGHSLTNACMPQCIQALEILDELVIPGSKDLDVRNKAQVRARNPCC